MLGALVAVALLLGACSDDDDARPPGGASASADAVALPITPADKATDVPVSAEIGAEAAGARLSEVALTDAAGAVINGALRADGSSWVPAEPLAYETTYTVKATGQVEGRDGSATTTFVTMKRPGNRMDAHVYMADNATYGQAMPIVVEFKQGGVAKAQRAAVERRLFVTSAPAQVGAWHWDSDIQVEYRPQQYWQPGTKLDVRLALGGLPVGQGRYGKTDITITAAIDTVKRAIEIDNAGKTLTATQDGAVVKTAPVSLGKASSPSFAGNMVIMERLDKTVFDSSTYGTPVSSEDGYRTKVQFAERLTWSGQFIHAAPWSVADQGKRNVSHGCVNVSKGDGEWIYNWVKVGDPVTVKGTEDKLPTGDGWTAWNLSWEDFLAGSALPTPTPAPSTT